MARKNESGEAGKVEESAAPVAAPVEGSASDQAAPGEAEAAPAAPVYVIEGKRRTYHTTSAVEAVNARARGRVVTEK